MQLVIDGANGAASHLAPELFERLGAQVDCIGCSPDGRNINLNCGSQHLEGLRARFSKSGADLGVAFDGDADRALFVSHSGKIVDGDAVLLICALPLHDAGRLNEVVATVMSNLGLERALRNHGIRLVRTPVGDKYVLEEMIKRDAPLGGEQSGHIIFREYSTAGDGMLTALRVLEVMRDFGRGSGSADRGIEIYPQRLVNVRVQGAASAGGAGGGIAKFAAAESEFGDAGRVLVRFSGTEPLARVMVEGPEHRSRGALCASHRGRDRSGTQLIAPVLLRSLRNPASGRPQISDAQICAAARSARRRFAIFLRAFADCRSGGDQARA